MSFSYGWERMTTVTTTRCLVWKSSFLNLMNSSSWHARHSNQVLGWNGKWSIYPNKTPNLHVYRSWNFYDLLTIDNSSTTFDTPFIHTLQYSKKFPKKKGLIRSKSFPFVHNRKVICSALKIMDPCIVIMDYFLIWKFENSHSDWIRTVTLGLKR